MSDYSQEYLHTLFDYKDGNLFWKQNRAKGKIKVGQEVGNISTRGYKRVMIEYKEIAVHRLIFLMHHGYMPNVIDHVNGNPLDNRIENLREATHQTNQYNKKIGRNNSSGCKNVSWNKKSHNWQVHIRQNKKVYCWYVKDFELAELIACEARSKFHKEFARHE
jgi:hypothetical protein